MTDLHIRVASESPEVRRRKVGDVLLAIHCDERTCDAVQNWSPQIQICDGVLWHQRLRRPIRAQLIHLLNSASFLAEISVRSPRKLCIFII